MNDYQTELREGFEELLEATEQTFAVLAGIIAEQTEPGTTLRELLHGEQALNLEFGPNGFRDRFFRRMLVRSSSVARRRAPHDAALQSLAASVLTPREDDPDMH